MYNKIKSFIKVTLRVETASIRRVAAYVSGNFKMLITAFVLGILVPYLSPMFVFADVTQFDGKSLEAAAISYHQQVNKTVNDFLERLIATDNPDVTYVSSDEGCGSGSASTYCLAVALNPILTEYITYLEGKRDSIAASDLGFDENEAPTLDQALSASVTRDTLIDSEVSAATETLDLTLAIYNQIQLVYPTHKELEALVDSLQDFNDGLADIRDFVETFPGKFNDATTIQCK